MSPSSEQEKQEEHKKWVIQKLLPPSDSEDEGKCKDCDNPISTVDKHEGDANREYCEECYQKDQEDEEVCCECKTDEDVEQCMECDKCFCIECDPNEMATYGEGDYPTTMCTTCGEAYSESEDEEEE